MKATNAARIHNYGGPGAVQVETASLADPKSGELLIRVHAAGVNPVDWKIRAGYLAQMVPLQFPITLGGDFSGVVDTVGDGVTDLKTGDDVYGQSGVYYGGSGSFAGYSIARMGAVAKKPVQLSHTEAAALPLVGVSALQTLSEHGRLTAGQKVLIHGGAGGIGSVAIQLAKHFGADVATTVRGDQVEYTKNLGADTVIDFKKQKFEDVLSGFDFVLDTVGGDTYVRSFKVLKKSGRLVSTLEQPREGLMKQFGVEAFVQFTQVTTDRLRELSALVDQGALKIHVDTTFPLDKAASALVHQEKERPTGKLVIKIL
jgi:alcohol dehydrogenase